MEMVKVTAQEDKSWERERQILQEILNNETKACILRKC